MSMRNGREDGASAVEFALIFPLLLTLIFGGITAGLALDNRQQMNHAAREGSRFGATLPVGDGTCGAGTTWQECVRDRTLAAAVNSVNLDRDTICVSLTTVSGDDESSNFWRYGTNAGAGTGTCFTETPEVSGARVQVRIERDALLNLVFLHPTIPMVSEAVSVFEAGAN